MNASKERKLVRNRALVAAAKEGPCVDCGIDWLPPQVMHLDHVRGVKKIRLGSLGSVPYTRRQIEEELAKCELRCPNCHSVRHYCERYSQSLLDEDLL